MSVQNSLQAERALRPKDQKSVTISAPYLNPFSPLLRATSRRTFYPVANEEYHLLHHIGPDTFFLQGWYISYIDRDPAVLARQAALEKMRKKDLDDQERQNLLMDRLVGEAREKGVAGPEYTGTCSCLLSSRSHPTPQPPTTTATINIIVAICCCIFVSALAVRVLLIAS